VGLLPLSFSYNLVYPFQRTKFFFHGFFVFIWCSLH
jgi:hypothetical protein